MDGSYIELCWLLLMDGPPWLELEAGSSDELACWLDDCSEADWELLWC